MTKQQLSLYKCVGQGTIKKGSLARVKWMSRWQTIPPCNNSCSRCKGTMDKAQLDRPMLKLLSLPPPSSVKFVRSVRWSSFRQS